MSVRNEYICVFVSTYVYICVRIFWNFNLIDILLNVTNQNFLTMAFHSSYTAHEDSYPLNQTFYFIYKYVES